MFFWIVMAWELIKTCVKAIWDNLFLAVLIFWFAMQIVLVLSK